MTDIATGFLRAIESFLNSRLGHMAETTWDDTGPFLGAVVTFDSAQRKAKFDELKADIEAMGPVFENIGKKIKKQTELIKKMVAESKTDIGDDDFDFDVAARVAIRIGMALSAADEAYNIIATELAKDAAGQVDDNIRTGLMDLWNPTAQPFKDLGAGAGNLLNKFGRLFGIQNLLGDLGETLVLDREGNGFKLVVKAAKSGPARLGALTLDQLSFEGFLQFSDREIAHPTDEEKKSLVQRGDKYYIGDVGIIGLRMRTILQPGLTSDPLLAKVMPGSSEPKTTTITAVSLDTGQGFYLGDGRGNEKAVLPVRFSYPAVELREMALGLVRNPAREVTAFEITTSIVAKMGDAVGMQVVGGGLVITPEGATEQQAMFEMPVSTRWPDAIGLRVKAGPITGGGFIQRVERTYKVDGKDVKRIEFGGVIQLQILNFGVSAIVILSPDPFSLVLVIGVRFPVAVELSFGFTLNGIGGILAIDRGLSLEALKAGMKDHLLDKMLFPDNPVADAPKLLDKVANVFPPRPGGFVVGPIVELGWGSQAKFVEMKLGVVLALPDPMIVVLGSLRVRVPTKEAPITDIKADVFVAITPDYLLLFASMRDSKIAGFTVSGDLGLYIEWSGSGGFEFSVGGFHPEYEKLVGKKPKLGEMDRLTIDLSPAKAISFVIKAYFAITAGSVQLGIDGRLNADFAVITAKAWLTLDMIFIWSPRFAFKVSIEVGVEVELLGFTFASIMFRGSLEGTRPFKLAGHLKVDVWFLPTFDEDLGPITWGDEEPQKLPPVDALAVAAAALNEPDSWKATLPEHAAQMVTLAEVDDVSGRIAHPLAGLEVSQTQIPLGVKITHVGASPVTADMVTLGMPVSSAGEAAAVSELRTPFAPGHFFDLEGEKLLARSGFEELQGGCRIAAATTPKLGAKAQENVAYRTYVRNEADRLLPDLRENWKFAAFGSAYVRTSNVGRITAAAANPYLPRPPADPPVDILPQGTSALTDIATGGLLLAGLGALSATEAAVIADSVGAAGSAVRTTVRG
ncbi:DUF6603 domain-containing protein [Mycobacterium sp. 4D054]|uniref:DUF6603 domain-containing protein n=1 Tax=Mycobacterium sp. 4D054 TaxID=3457440 RepID=UPI003FD50BFB